VEDEENTARDKNTTSNVTLQDDFQQLQNQTFEMKTDLDSLKLIAGKSSLTKSKT